eukprot:snap_masked-scaffold_17-processed-gene-6.15-mRNA-1 protein AED:1.00 eAED:1.00 QI:0/0/0/0/1/1/2/0/59
MAFAYYSVGSSKLGTYSRRNGKGKLVVYFSMKNKLYIVNHSFIGGIPAAIKHFTSILKK